MEFTKKQKVINVYKVGPIMFKNLHLKNSEWESGKMTEQKQRGMCNEAEFITELHTFSIRAFPGLELELIVLTLTAYKAEAR